MSIINLLKREKYMSSVGSTGQYEYGSFSTSSNEYDLPFGKVPKSGNEQTSPALVEKYKDLLRQLREAAAKNDPTQFQAILNALGALAQEGDRSTTPPSYMQPEMLEDLNLILLLAKGFGFNVGQQLPQNPTEALKDLNNYEQLDKNGKKTGITFSRMLEDAISVSGSQRSLQSMLYADFVIGATAVYEAKLESLEEMLELLKKIDALLTKLQQFRNKLILTQGTPGWVDNPPVQGPQIRNPTYEELYDYVKTRDELKAALAELKGTRIPPDPVGSLAPEGSLEANLENVIKDINMNDVHLDQLPKNQQEYDSLRPRTPPKHPKLQQYDWGRNSAYNWVYDNNNVVGGNAGKYQDNLTKAVTASVALNDTQKEELRSMQYGYEQCMKIATQLMQSLSKIITSMAQHGAK